MPLYMKYGEIDGKVETKGYEKWIEVNTFQWGVGRGISSPIGSSADREASHPSVSEVSLSKEMDVATNKLLEEALGSTMNAKVELAVCTTGAGQLTEFLRYTLFNTGLSSYAVASGGDRPKESLSLNFTKIEIKYTSLNIDLHGNPSATTYDLAKQTLNG